MFKGVLIPSKDQPAELRKVVNRVQGEFMRLGVARIFPRTVRLRLHGDEPEAFPKKQASSTAHEAKIAAHMVHCPTWSYLDQLV